MTLIILITLCCPLLSLAQLTKSRPIKLLLILSFVVIFLIIRPLRVTKGLNMIDVVFWISSKVGFSLQREVLACSL